MFNKVFRSISKALASPAKTEEKPMLEAIIGKKGSVLAAAKASSKAAQAGKVAPQTSPEDLCGLDGKMGKDEIRAKLAALYKRYNRAASSLDAKLRGESEIMLDAIVTLREKHFGPI